MSIAALTAMMSLSASSFRALPPLPLEIDIHLPVSGPAFDVVLAANSKLNEALNSSGVDFKNTDTPHITLYLTEFSCPGTPAGNATDACVTLLKSEMKKVMPNLYPPNGPCHVSFGTPYAAGSYAMLNVSLDQCLQTYSDDVVLGTNSLSQPNQTVPSWVHSLPEPERSIKTALVKQFGSPNVFSQFQPHVTLAWGSDDDAVAAAVEALGNLSVPSFVGDIVALGSTGDHGTVLQNQDFAVYNTSGH